MCFDVDSAGNRADAENLNQLVAIREACGTELLKTDLFKILGLCELLEDSQIHGLVLHTVDIFETEFGKTALQGHLTAFKTYFMLIARTRLSSLMTAGRCASFARTGTAADTGLTLYGAHSGLQIT